MLSLGGAAAAGASSSSSVADSILAEMKFIDFVQVPLIKYTFVVHGHRGGFHSVGHLCGLCFICVLFHVVTVETQQWDEICPEGRVVVAQVHSLQETVVLEIALRKNIGAFRKSILSLCPKAYHGNT
jgi:hypothetical protein